MFEGWLTWVEGSADTPGGCPFIVACTEYDDRPGPIRSLLDRYLGEFMAGLRRSASLAVDAGHFHADLDLDQFAYDFYALVLAHHHFSRFHRDRAVTDRSRASFERLLADCRRSLPSS